jgi:CheY-like chemotaxis protein
VGSLLLVESDPDTRNRLGNALQGCHHEVLITYSMRDAFMRVSEGGIDVILIDSYDPRVGVVELVREINLLPDTPPVVLVSASPHAPEISARIGAAAFVPKPIVVADLLEVIERVSGALRPVRAIEDFGDEEPSGSTRQLG